MYHSWYKQSAAQIRYQSPYQVWVEPLMHTCNDSFHLRRPSNPRPRSERTRLWIFREPVPDIQCSNSSVKSLLLCSTVDSTCCTELNKHVQSTCILMVVCQLNLAIYSERFVISCISKDITVTVLK